MKNRIESYLQMIEQKRRNAGARVSVQVPAAVAPKTRLAVLP